ncbi:MAG: MBL fold metallo-hydrolase [Longimicrobiales bacterium]|nr:MBL fold metallo-hydrolase [Longimicrobiales bacterium]
MKVSVLGSGSRGNSTLMESGGTRILVDAGFSGKDLARRLQAVDVDPDSIDAIVVTHDHGDHTRGVGIFARRHDTAVFITETTRNACSKLFRGGERLEHYRPGRPFNIGDLRIEPFLTVHDAVDPVAVTVVDEPGGVRVGIATDLGRPTAHVRHALSECHLLVLEANHDDVLLQQAPYPSSVKARITSSHGHLSNNEAAQLATELFHPRLAAVLLAHLSAESNHPDLAYDVVRKALHPLGFRGHLEVVRQDRPTELLDVGELRRRVGPEQLSLL